MQIKKLNESIAFTSQLKPKDIRQISELGYTQLICNRPDNEEIGQPTISSIRDEADAHGVSLVYAPVADSDFSEDVISTTKKALLDAQKNNGKTLMFCRSGTRSSVLWAIIETRLDKPLAKTLNELKSIGYDISHLQSFILEKAKIN